MRAIQFDMAHGSRDAARARPIQPEGAALSSCGARPTRDWACRHVISYDPHMSAPLTPAQADEVQQAAPATRVLRQFRIVFNSVKTHFRQVEREAGVGGAQLWALSVIARRPGIGVTELSRELDIHQSTASNLIKSLTERGLVTAAREGMDRRSVALRISADGEAVLNSAPMPFAGVLPDALSSLDPGTLGRLEEDLGKLIALLEADESSAKVLLSQQL
jgi:DNA-binding MarR family transcriptional regulator